VLTPSARTGLHFVRGNLLASPAQTLVNPVNGVGVLGRGLARQFRDAFPDLLPAYQAACRAGALRPGRLWLFRGSRWILCFPTKRHWRDPARLDDIAAGLATFARTYAALGITSAAFPALGCGAGGLAWDAVRPLLEQFLGPLPLPLWVYLPSGS